MSGLSNCARKERAARIRELNDAFRTTFTGGRIMMTASVAALPEGVRAVALRKVATFANSAFERADDPYGEHDFISFGACDHIFFFKIDYYDPDLEHHSEDPADPEKTLRVGTLMLSSDY